MARENQAAKVRQELFDSNGRMSAEIEKLKLEIDKLSNRDAVLRGDPEESKILRALVDRLTALEKKLESKVEAVLELPATPKKKGKPASSATPQPTPPKSGGKSWFHDWDPHS